MEIFLSIVFLAFMAGFSIYDREKQFRIERERKEIGDKRSAYIAMYSAPSEFTREEPKVEEILKIQEINDCIERIRGANKYCRNEYKYATCLYYAMNGYLHFDVVFGSTLIGDKYSRAEVIAFYKELEMIFHKYGHRDIDCVLYNPGKMRNGPEELVTGEMRLRYKFDTYTNYVKLW